MSLGDKFTNRARAVLKMAKEIAIESKATGIDTHHILGAIWKDGGGVAVATLLEFGITNLKLTRALNKILTEEITNQEATEKILLTEHSKEVIATANKKSKELGHNIVGTEHLLLAILSIEQCTAYELLTEKFGLVYEEVENKIVNLLAGAEEVSEYKDNPDEEVTSSSRPKRGIKESPFITKFCVDMTSLAEQGKLDPTIGRRNEIERVMQILGRKTKNNPVLIGEPGTGKSKIVEGIAQAIVAGNVPDILRDKRLCAVDLPAMIAGTKYRGQFEERIKGLLKEVQDRSDVILFFDELHTMVGAGSSEGGMDASNIMKPALSRGFIQCVGATTLDEYRKHIEKDGALERRFQPIVVNPTSRDETIKILEGLQENYEAHHGVKYTPAALEAAVELAERFISDRFLPDKAIDVIDEAGSKVRMKSTFKPPELHEKEQELEVKTNEKQDAVHSQKYEEAAKLRDEVVKLRDEVDALEAVWREELKDNGMIIDEETIARIVASMTGVPVTQVTEEESERLLHIEDELHRSVISQDEAIVKISEAIRRSRAGLNDPRRPVGSFLFVGPTGVGKTLLCKSLAKFLFGTEDALIQLDMSEYMEKHNVSRLVGAPPGYIGYEEGGQLTERVRRKPYSIVLFDEIEKAHTDVFNMLLQIMEEGKLTDSFGRSVNFRNTIIVMTSNVGSDLLRSSTSLGFVKSTDNIDYEQMKKTLNEEIEKTFKPEFINRLDEIVAFSRLTKSDMSDILEIETQYLRNRLKEQGFELAIDPDAKRFLIDEGYSEIFGARPLKRVIRKYIENPLSRSILEGKFKTTKRIVVNLNSDGTDVEFVGESNKRLITDDPAQITS